MWGLMGVIYNTKAVDEEDLGSWDLLWNEKDAGDILMIDNSRDAIGIALKRLGCSYNTTDENRVRQAVDLLVDQWPIVQAYVMDDIFQKLEGANAYVGTYYYGDYLTMYENNPDLGFYIPEEGTNIYVDAMCILKDAPNKENAEAFINYMCSTQAGLKNCEAIWYSSPLLSVREELDPEIADDPYAYPDADIMAQVRELRRPAPEYSGPVRQRVDPAQDHHGRPVLGSVLRLCPIRTGTGRLAGGLFLFPVCATAACMSVHTGVKYCLSERLFAGAARAAVLNERMKFSMSIEPGMTGRAESAVTERNTALAVGSGALPVFATPMMAALMEAAAVDAVSAGLEAGQGTVGTRLDITHDAATPVGMKVWRRRWSPPLTAGKSALP